MFLVHPYVAHTRKTPSNVAIYLSQQSNSATTWLSKERDFRNRAQDLCKHCALAPGAKHNLLGLPASAANSHEPPTTANGDWLRTMTLLMATAKNNPDSSIEAHSIPLFRQVVKLSASSLLCVCIHLHLNYYVWFICLIFIPSVRTKFAFVFDYVLCICIMYVLIIEHKLFDEMLNLTSLPQCAIDMHGCIFLYWSCWFLEQTQQR